MRVVFCFRFDFLSQDRSRSRRTLVPGEERDPRRPGVTVYRPIGAPRPRSASPSEPPPLPPPRHHPRRVARRPREPSHSPPNHAPPPRRPREPSHSPPPPRHPREPSLSPPRHAPDPFANINPPPPPVWPAFDITETDDSDPDTSTRVAPKSKARPLQGRSSQPVPATVVQEAYILRFCLS